MIGVTYSVTTSNTLELNVSFIELKIKMGRIDFMKYNLNQIKKTEQVIFKALEEIPHEKVGITELTNDITNTKIYFLIYKEKAYINIDFLVRKLEVTKEKIFSLINEDNILVDSYTYRSGIHYYLTINDAFLLVKESAVKDKDKHLNGLQYVFNTALEKYRKSVEFKVECKKLKIK